MKIAKVTLIVLDHEGFGKQENVALLEQQKYLTTRVADYEETDIGEWYDEHPLNQMGDVDITPYFESQARELRQENTDLYNRISRLELELELIS